MLSPVPEVYSPDEIARAAGIPEAQVVAAIGRDVLVPFADAVRLGRSLTRGRHAAPTVVSPPLFSIFSNALARQSGRPAGVPLFVSSTLHLTIVAVAIFVATLGLAPTAATLRTEDRVEPMRLVFMAPPGPGGGGGGGGLLQKAPPPQAMREGHEKMSSPLPVREPPKPIVPTAAPPEPTPAPLNSEPLPVVVAPIVSAPADTRNRVGILEQTTAQGDSHGSGRGGGIGTGAGTGLGEGDGSGIGPGSGGGIGGGPYRPGSGIEPPRLLREVKADYTEDARQRGVEGDVVLEIVVKRDGSVGDVKVLQGLISGLNERAVQAVRQWRFTPAHRQAQAVDVIVEVAVEFKLR
jgi:TonB family protein